MSTIQNSVIKEIQLTLPQILALLHVGATSYIVFIDPRVRRSHRETIDRLNHWSSLYKNGKIAMSCLSVSTILSALNCYRM